MTIATSCTAQIPRSEYRQNAQSHLAKRRAPWHIRS